MDYWDESVIQPIIGLRRFQNTLGTLLRSPNQPMKPKSGVSLGDFDR